MKTFNVRSVKETIDELENKYSGNISQYKSDLQNRIKNWNNIQSSLNLSLESSEKLPFPTKRIEEKIEILDSLKSMLVEHHCDECDFAKTQQKQLLDEEPCTIDAVQKYKEFLSCCQLNCKKEYNDSLGKVVVTAPGYYKISENAEVIDIIEQLDLDFNLGSAIKCVVRSRSSEEEITDLKKAIWYLEREIKKIEKV